MYEIWGEQLGDFPMYTGKIFSNDFPLDQLFLTGHTAMKGVGNSREIDYCEVAKNDPRCPSNAIGLSLKQLLRNEEGSDCHGIKFGP